MKKSLSHTAIIVGLFLFLSTPYLSSANTLLNESVISGTVIDGDTETPLPNVNISIKNKVVGTSTDAKGNFSLTVNQDPPLTLVFSSVGYTRREVEITSNNTTDLTVRMNKTTLTANEVVVSASRMEESILEAPVTIEKMDLSDIRSTASNSYYDAIGNLKGVDITASSINFKIINSRGFNSTGNTRMVQLIDGMDTQAPALNFPVGNLNGPNVLDVEGAEYIPGAASALYGPNAFNGILLMTSKDPFNYQGLSVMVKAGMNHLNGKEQLGEPADPQPMYDAAIRYAKAFNDKFAFKVNASYKQAEDWRGINYSDKNNAVQGELSINPAYNGVHLYGDDGSFNIGLLGLSQGFIQTISNTFDISTADAQKYAGALPPQPVNRTGYREHYIVDNNAQNLKLNTALHYRLNEGLEASYSFNYGYGTSVYTGAQRYSLNNFSVSQHKVQLGGDSFNLKAYGTFENSGDSYIADFVGYYINGVSSDPNGNDPAAGNTNWFGTYGATMVGAYIQQVMQATGSTDFNPQVVEAINSNPEALSSIFKAARDQADASRLVPGTTGFQTAKEAALENTIPTGARFNDNSRFYHVEGQYNLKEHINFVDLLLGASFRQFQLRSNGTIFDDADGGVNINEWGTYLQAQKSLFEGHLDLTGSIRYDKNENFDGQFSPRISGVLTVAEGHNFRGSFQTGFRNPDTQAQYIDLNVVNARLLGGLPKFAQKYEITKNAYTLESVQQFTNDFLATQSPDVGLLNAFESFDPVKPEQVQAFEVGYKGLLGGKLYFDAAYYYNIYDDFISQIRVRKASGPFTGQPSDQAVIASLLSGDFQNTFQIYSNIDKTVKAHGAAVGLEYSLPSNFSLGVNYNWNKLITDLGAFQNNFNTPEHKINISLGNRYLFDNVGFNITYRWQDEFQWNSNFISTSVDAVSTVDAQINYRVPQYNTTVKIGGSDIFNNRYVLNGGGPNLGGIYYISLTFDSLFR